jgi:hypothetical protein
MALVGTEENGLLLDARGEVVRLGLGGIRKLCRGLATGERGRHGNRDCLRQSRQCVAVYGSVYR